MQWLTLHLPGADANRRALLRHASRGLLEQGHAGALAAWGLGRPWRGDATFGVSPRRIRLGETLTLSLALQASGRARQRLAIDYAVHHVKANGGRTRKVFKGWTLEIGAGEARSLLKRHAVREITTRRYYSGPHLVELLINGRVSAQASFELRV